MNFFAVQKVFDFSQIYASRKCLKKNQHKLAENS